MASLRNSSWNPGGIHIISSHFGSSFLPHSKANRQVRSPELDFLHCRSYPWWSERLLLIKWCPLLNNSVPLEIFLMNCVGRKKVSIGRFFQTMESQTKEHARSTNWFFIGWQWKSWRRTLMLLDKAGGGAASQRGKMWFRTQLWVAYFFLTNILVSPLPTDVFIDCSF